jgi:ribosomal-protein-alanine N-acetyltransferase
VVGYIGMLRSLEDGHVTTIAVDPAWHRRGIGTRLLAAAARAAMARDCQNLTLEVRVSNAGAQELYRRFGFAPAGIRKAYYPDNGEDALIMWANDIDSAGYARRLTEIDATLRGFTVIEGDWV